MASLAPPAGTDPYDAYTADELTRPKMPSLAQMRAHNPPSKLRADLFEDEITQEYSAVRPDREIQSALALFFGLVAAGALMAELVSALLFR